ncbi:MAG TPA: LysR substrate-binding domain-containing protein, partial [Negativicutes bacterium]
CAEYGFVPNVANRSRDLAALLFMVEVGMGIMLVPGPVRDIISPELRIVELYHPDQYLDVMVAWTHNNPNPSVPIYVTHLLNHHAWPIGKKAKTKKPKMHNVS